MGKQKILFMCTGNSCRSQLAEAIVNSRFGNTWQAFSAGSKPAGYVHPLAIKALSKMGIPHQGRSKSIAEFRDQSFDVVVTLCDQAENECPVWLGRGKQVHMPFPDPALATGTEAEKMETFLAVASDISQQVNQLLGQIK